MFNFNDGLPAIIQPDHATIKSRDRTHLYRWHSRSIMDGHENCL